MVLPPIAAQYSIARNRMGVCHPLCTAHFQTKRMHKVSTEGGVAVDHQHILQRLFYLVTLIDSFSINSITAPVLTRLKPPAVILPAGYPKP